MVIDLVKGEFFVVRGWVPNGATWWVGFATEKETIKQGETYEDGEITWIIPAGSSLRVVHLGYQFYEFKPVAHSALLLKPE